MEKMSKHYFSHDVDARADEKILEMFYYFRHNKELLEESLLPYAALGVYWSTIEYMHKNSLQTEKIDVFADSLRISSEFLTIILENFRLFEKKDGEYISKRVLKNLKLQKEKAEKAKQSAQKRWKNGQNQQEKPPESQESEKKDTEIKQIAYDIYNIYKTVFKKTQITTNENLLKIQDITEEYGLTTEQWQIIFNNAKRGWIYGDKKVAIPFKKILEDWSGFLNDEAFLPPDEEKIKKEKEERERVDKKAEEKINEYPFSEYNNLLFCYDDYRILRSSVKLKALEIYEKSLAYGTDDAIKETIKFCRKADNDA